MSENDRPDEASLPTGGEDDLDAQFQALIAGLEEVEAEELETLPDLDLGAVAADSVHTYRCLVVILTPVASAEALAGLCSMSGLDLEVIPTPYGAVVFEELELSAEEMELAGLLGGAQQLPEAATAVAKRLTELAHTPVVLMVSWLAPGSEIEPDVSGQVCARRFEVSGGEVDLPAGLIIAQMDNIVEDLLLGRCQPGTVAGTQKTRDIPRWKALRMLGKGLRKPGKNG